MKVKFPCKECTNRNLGCHAICEKYLAAHKENTELREKIYEIKQKNRRYA